jgi:putative ABC transport system permease protein
MGWITEIWQRMRSIRRRHSLESGLDEEIRFHIDRQAEKNRRAGMSPDEARRQALIAFGGPERVKEHTRDEFRPALLEDLVRDLRYGARALRRAPGFTLVSVLTLALGIGAVTVIYSVVHNVVVDPLPYRDAERLVNVFVLDTRTDRVRGAFSPSELLDFRNESSVFEDVIGTSGQGVRYETPDRVEYLRGVWVTPNFFDFMGLKPLLGRSIVPEDGRPGAPAVAVLRYRAWMMYFGGDPSVVGRTVVLNEEPRTIVGVMPPRFTWHAADLWIPGPLDRSAPNVGPPSRNFQARLARGVTLQQAEAQLNVIAERRARAHPNDYPEQRRMRVVNVIEYTVGPFSGVLYTTLAAVGLLLLIACCNVANMLLARATTREREMMIRMSLGAGRGRIVRQLMVESVLLAAGGAALGCLLAYVGIDALVARLPQSPLPGEVDIALNTPVLLFSLGAAVLSAVLFGMAPALYTARRDLAGSGVKSGGKGIAGGRSRLRNGLVTAEIALALVLVLGAGLLTRSFMAVMRVDLGFKPDNLLAVWVAFPPARYTAAPERHRFYRDALERIGSLPGVHAVAATTTLPPLGAGTAVPLEIPGKPNAIGSRAAVASVTGDYFRTLGIPFTRGAGFSDVAVDDTPRLAVVNATFIKRYFNAEDPVGRQIKLAPADGPSDPARHGVFEIVGVVDDVRNQGLREPAEPQVYLPWSSAGRVSPLILVRTATDPLNSLSAVRRELSLVDRQVAVVQLRTLPEMLDQFFYAQPRFSLLVLGIFATTGILLVGVGVFSVMAYAVSRQKKEIAVRMALGARRSHVYSVILRLGAQLLAAGATIGILASFATNRLLATQLWNVSPHDPLTLAAATMIVSLIALAACYIPARRAMQIDPMAALRED